MDKDLANINCSSLALQRNLKDELALLRTDSAKVVRRWQNGKWNILQINLPRSVRKGNVYTLYATEMRERKQTTVPQDKKTGAVLQHSPTKLF